MQSKHNLFKYSLKEAVVNLIKIKSSDQMFTACVCIGDCFLSRWSGLSWDGKKMYVIFIQLGMKWEFLLTLKENNSYKTYN
jgi:hypothetical protein